MSSPTVTSGRAGAAPTTIPRVARFIWFGERFPWTNVVALRSAARAGGFERVVLHHDAPVEALRASAGGDAWAKLEAEGGFEAQWLDLAGLWAAVDARAAGLGARLGALFGQLTAPAARANMVRAALLYTRGGVYLDTDTVTVASFEDLCEASPVFCGAEPIAWPQRVLRSRSPVLWGRAVALHGVRDVLRRVPGGRRVFPRVQGYYFSAVNNAVFAAAPGHAFVRGLLEAMVDMAPERQLKRFALGTHLLQARVAQAATDSALRGEVRVYPPAYFYPLAPEISEHWFRLPGPLTGGLGRAVGRLAGGGGGRDMEASLAAALRPETRTVHWYASVRTKAIVPRVDPAYVRRHAHEQLFSALALPYA